MDCIALRRSSEPSDLSPNACPACEPGTCPAAAARHVDYLRIALLVLTVSSLGKESYSQRQLRRACPVALHGPPNIANV
jgi:hypothetical protein